MKKLYFFISCLITSVSFGQIFSDDFNYANTTLLTANGWIAHSGMGNQAVDVGTSNGLTYTDYSGLTGFTAAEIGNAARLDNNGEDVNKAFLTAVTSGDLYVSFLVNVANAVDGYFFSLGTGTSTFYSRLYARPSATSGKINFGIGNSNATYSSTDFDVNTTYLVVIKYSVSATGPVSLWVLSSGIPATEALAGPALVSASGSGGANVAGVYLRQYNASQNITVDGLRVYTTWFNTTACPLTLSTETATCDFVTSSIDNYTISIPFTGGATGSYNLMATSGTISGDDPSTMANGNIIISGVSEGTNVTLSVTGTCSLSKLITAPECKLTNTLPVSEPFNYTVGSALSTSQMWSNTSVGTDEITTITSNLSYSGITPTGNSVSMAGPGSDTKLPFTDTTSGELYASFLISITDLTGINTTGNTYFAVLSNSANSFTVARIYLKTDGTLYQYGISPTTTTADIVWSSNTYSIASTQYLVLRYDFTNNILQLYENPTIGGSSSASVSVTPTNSISSLANFILRQDTANSTPAMIIDELSIRTTSDFTLSSSSFNTIKEFTMHPNPTNLGYVNISSKSNTKMDVALFDVLGKQVLKQTVSNNVLNVSKLNVGVYVMKVVQDNATITKKLVIK